MDTCSIDITLEFLSVALHSILYYTSVYPENVFEKRKKYSTIVYRCIHPEVNNYIEMCLKSIQNCLKLGRMDRIEFCVTDDKWTKSYLTFVFDVTKNCSYDELADAYLVACEQNLRAFCLKMTTLTENYKNLPEDISFMIKFHSDESNAVSLAKVPELEGFPLVEVHSKDEESESVIPIRQFNLRHLSIDTYIEL